MFTHRVRGVIMIYNGKELSREVVCHPLHDDITNTEGFNLLNKKSVVDGVKCLCTTSAVRPSSIMRGPASSKTSRLKRQDYLCSKPS